MPLFYSMPCDSSYMYGSEGPDTDDQGKTIDNLVTMLCGVCKRIERQITEPDPRLSPHWFIEADPALNTWWKEHKKHDTVERKRVAAIHAKEVKLQELKRSALAKLTKAELEALGISK